MPTAILTNEELLKAIKTRLGITGDYQDELLLAYAEDVKAFAMDGGVDFAFIDTSASVGLIARGVADLWNYEAGDGKFSAVFVQRLTQLAYACVVNSESQGGCHCPTLEEISTTEIDECTKCLTDNVTE